MISAFVKGRSLALILNFRRRLAVLVFAFSVLFEARAQVAQITATSIASNGWTRVEGAFPKPFEESSCLRLAASTNLVDWREIAVMHGQKFSFIDPASPALGSRYYRFSAEPLDETNNDWKNQVNDYTENFGAEYIKFVIYKNDPTRVFYSDGLRHQFHFDFVSSRLPGYAGIDGTHFQEITRYNATRELYIGSIIWVPSPNEYAIQFDGADPLPPDEVAALFRLVESTVVSGRPTNAPRSRAFYLPSYEQTDAARLSAGYFESNGIPLATLDRWAIGDAAYSFGRAVGRLRFVNSTNINAAYSAGDLLATDVLVTDGIPAEIPFVAGIISLTPATPNSHVAILARSYAVPFVYFRDEQFRNELLTWTNRDVALEAVEAWGGAADLHLLPLSDDFPGDLRAQILAITSSGNLDIKPKARYGAYTAPTDNLTPADIKYFGGKAANFGILRRTIPSNSPPAIAISLDLWDDFMSQPLPSGLTLREEIAQRLAPYTNGSNIAALKTALNGVRDLIRRDTVFTDAQREAIISALHGFDASKKIRFRSSTNVEDAESFTGAGLYDSFSGCLLDDLDDDTRGPCLCDPAETNERGVFRAIQRVYSSFYNDNAVLARLRFGIDESKVGMGILVHYSTPDEFELANGVATVLRRTYGPAWHEYQTDFVTQVGATSVANPDTAARPETMHVYTSQVNGFGPPQYSSLLPLGQTVLKFSGEYEQLLSFFIPVADAWAAYYTNKSEFTLDFEYKKISPGVLQVKQVREIPMPDRERAIDPFLIKRTIVRETHQGIGQEAFSTHRAKTRWTFTTKNMRLTEANVAGGLFERVAMERANNGRVEQFSGDPAALPNYRCGYTNGVAFMKWTMDTADGPAEYELTYDFYTLSRTAAESLFNTFDDRAPELTVTYARTNLNRFNWFGEIEQGGVDATRLWIDAQRSATDVQFKHMLLVTSGANTNIVIRMDTNYYLDGPEIYTSYPRLVGELTTRIEGLTSEPINLTGYFSQSFEGVHLLRSERFVFEPRLEPGISPAILAELEALDIQQLIFTHRFDIPRLRIIGRDRQLRDW